MSWRLSTKDLFKVYIEKNNISYNSVYMFGVYTGESVWDMINILGNKYQYWAFDSFEGLPEETKEPIAQECWKKGDFNAMEKLGCSSIEETIKVVNEKVSSNISCSPSLKWVPGYFNQSLQKLIEEKCVLGPALYVDIDCDLYSSTVDALDFLFRNKVIRRGTVIGYDDWGGSPGWFANVDGESRAHAEMCEKYGVTAVKVFQSGNRFPHVQTMWIVTEVNNPDA